MEEYNPEKFAGSDYQFCNPVTRNKAIKNLLKYRAKKAKSKEEENKIL